jgi:hypothetical protein
MIAAHELELVQTREMMSRADEELSRGREPTHGALPPVPEKQKVPVLELREHPVREPMSIEWRSPERQLGQLKTLVKQVDAPSLTMKEVITPAKVRDAMTREIDCPEHYLGRLVKSPEYQRWLALEREREERARIRTRGIEARARGLARTRD